jgi:hypothetical protein
MIQKKKIIIEGVVIMFSHEGAQRLLNFENDPICLQARKLQTHEIIVDWHRARQCEWNHQWLVARDLWRLTGRHDDAKTVSVIMHSNYLGNWYRSLSSPVYKKWEEHHINNRELHDELVKINLIVYKREY